MQKQAGRVLLWLLASLHKLPDTFLALARKEREKVTTGKKHCLTGVSLSLNTDKESKWEHTICLFKKIQVMKGLH